MSTVVAALAPIFAVILIGLLARRLRLVADGFWEPAERLTFYLLFPSLLVTSTARADFGGVGALSLFAACVGGIVGVTTLAFVIGRRLALDGPALTSLLQASVRPNVYVALAAAASLHGERGLALISLCIAVAVPLVNTLGVLALVRWGRPAAGPSGRLRMIGAVLTNPLILACAIGIGLNIGGVGLPPLVGPTLDVLGRAALPIGLLAVGAGLDPVAAVRAGGIVAWSSALKLVALPCLTLALAQALGLDDVARAIVVLYASVPVSASAYVMARQMGGDAPLLAGAISASTLAAFVTMPIVLTLP